MKSITIGTRGARNAGKAVANVTDGMGEERCACARMPIEQVTFSATSGKVEYDNKGQPVRSYQPYFIDDWRYLADTAMRSCGYADTHYYDATGREAQVITAKGYLRRNGYFPWFTVAEDENDTWQPSA
jgi:hypothetical protein